MFEKNIYVQRRNVLKKKVGSGLILFLGNSESPMNYRDNPFHFRQDSSFLYYFGIDRPGLTAIIDVDNDQETIFGDEYSIDDIIWRGPQPTIEELASLVGVAQTGSAHEIPVKLVISRNEDRLIHYLPCYRSEHYLKLGDWLVIKRAEIEHGVSVELIKAIAEQRSVKAPEEIEEIEKAVKTTGEMHLTAMQMARPGMKEVELAAAVQEVAVRNGGQLSFPTIMTINGETLHNHYHGNILKNWDVVLNDSGAETAMHYGGDMTRTFPAGKKFTNQQKELYDIVYNAHKKAVSALKPGTKYLDVHLTASRALTEGLKELSILKGDTQELVEMGVHTLFFQCGTGHMMGLDIHDMENLGEQYVGYRPGLEKSKEFGLKSLRLAKELEPGYVLTVEPGLYFIPQLIDMWHSEKKHIDFINYDKVMLYKEAGGYRVEEDFLITEKGRRLLGKKIPITSDDVEEVRKAAY